MREMHELAVEPLAGDLLDLELRMRERQTQQLATGVPGRTDDGDGNQVSAECRMQSAECRMVTLRLPRQARSMRGGPVRPSSRSPHSTPAPRRRGKSPPCARECSRWLAQCCCETPWCSSLG